MYQLIINKNNFEKGKLRTGTGVQFFSQKAGMQQGKFVRVERYTL